MPTYGPHRHRDTENRSQRHDAVACDHTGIATLNMTAATADRKKIYKSTGIEAGDTRRRSCPGLVYESSVSP